MSWALAPVSFVLEALMLKDPEAEPSEPASTEPKTTCQSEEEVRRYLSIANEGRLACEKPRLSGFRVAAVIVYIDTEAITALYLVSDSAQAITPGALCREWMSSYPKDELDPDTFLITTAGTSATKILWDTALQGTLGLLYPVRSLYAGLCIDDVVALFGQPGSGPGPEASAACRPCAPPPGLYLMAYESAMLATGQRRYHPVSYACAIAFTDGDTSVSVQHTALEYGCTLDCLGMLAATVTKKALAGAQVDAVLVVDNYGVAHAPFAIGRAFLSECNACGWASVHYMETQQEGQLSENGSEWWSSGGRVWRWRRRTVQEVFGFVPEIANDLRRPA
eukprot:gene5364-956_t